MDSSEFAGTQERFDAELRVARAVVLAHILPMVKAEARQAAQRDLSLDNDRLTGISPSIGMGLAAATSVEQALADGSADAAERQGAKRASASFAALAPGLVATFVVRRATVAAGAAGRLRHLACLIDTHVNPSSPRILLPESPPARGGPDGPAPWPDTDLVHLSRTVATTRAAHRVLERLAPQLEADAERIAAHLRKAAKASGDHQRRADPRLRRRLAAARLRRTRRALVLADALSRRASPPSPQRAPLAPADPLPSGHLLAWLRSLLHVPLYADDFEAAAADWLGPDPFRLRELPMPPDFLVELDITSLPARLVAPFLRSISLVRGRPRSVDLLPSALERELEKRAGGLSCHARSRSERRWGQPATSNPPLLPRITEIPHVVHGVWLGKPIPDNSSFWDNYAAGAHQYQGQVDFVLWTDVPRSRFEAARLSQPQTGGRPDPLRYERTLLSWAETSGIHLVNVHEVFHALAPMALRAPYALEMAKQLPRGYTSACDHLRVEIVTRFGGAYVDGDNSFPVSPSGGLPALFDEVAASPRGFTLNPIPGLGVANDIILAPARHPMLELWRECARLNYVRTQRELFGDLKAMAQPFVGRAHQEQRDLAPLRTGRVHHWVLGLLRIDSATLPVAHAAIACGSELSWVSAPPDALTDSWRNRAGACTDEVVEVLARCLTFLRWQLIVREGDLYLTAVDPVIRSLPDPDAAWTALLIRLSQDRVGAPPVTSLTDLRRETNKQLSRVLLPPEAEALIDRNPIPSGWLGAELSRDGRGVWLLDERCTPARLRDAVEPSPKPALVLAALAEVAVDPLGQVVGLWVRDPQDADIWRRDDRFAAVPHGHLGVSFGGPHLADWGPEPGLRADALATLISELDTGHRPVLLCAPPATATALESLAGRLQRLLRVPVTLRSRSGGSWTPTVPQYMLLPRVRYIPYGEFLRLHREDKKFSVK